MNRLTILIALVLLAITLPTTAQEKKFFTPEDASYNNRGI